MNKPSYLIVTIDDSQGAYQIVGSAEIATLTMECTTAAMGN